MNETMASRTTSTITEAARPRSARRAVRGAHVRPPKLAGRQRAADVCRHPPAVPHVIQCPGKRLRGQHNHHRQHSDVNQHFDEHHAALPAV
jgi:hypothetical protein